MRRLNPITSLAIAMTFLLCGLLAGSARADEHGHDGGQDGDHGRRHGDGEWHNRGERHGRGQREYGPDVRYYQYYEPAPEVYYAPPLVVYPPPRASSGISIFLPFWFR